MLLVYGKNLPNLDKFFRETFGCEAGDVLMFPGPRRNTWDSASIQGIIFRLYNPKHVAQDPSCEPLVRSFSPTGRIRAIVVMGSPQEEEVLDFVQQELLPALADRTQGVILLDDEVIYRGQPRTKGRRKEVQTYPYLELLREKRIAIRSRPPAPPEDWSDL